MDRGRCLVVALLVLCTLSGSAALAATETAACADAVVGDWYDNGRVDAVYPLRCYPAAIEDLPADVRDYSSARDEITRALAEAENRPKDRATPVRRSATPPADTDGVSKLPLALLLLSGLTIVLIAAGAAGYAARRFRRDEQA